MLRTVTATRYVTPLREGGSLPALVEADDNGLYVLKFRGAGQGPKALIAELVAGAFARAAGLNMPEIVLMRLDADLARTEPDPEIQDLIRASAPAPGSDPDDPATADAGLNLALDYLPGSVTFDPLAHPPSAELASRIVWHDAFVTNVDRTPRNSNLLVWHRQLWLIDHGAALIFHHNWGDPAQQSRTPFAMVKDHVLLPWATAIAAADAFMATRITPAVIAQTVASIPDSWLADAAANETLFASPAAHRAAYEAYFLGRLAARPVFVQAAVQAAQQAAEQAARQAAPVAAGVRKGPDAATR